MQSALPRACAAGRGRLARTAHQRLAGSNGTSINRLSRNGCLTHTRHPGQRLRLGLLQTGHQIGPGRDHGAGGWLPCQRRTWRRWSGLSGRAGRGVGRARGCGCGRSGWSRCRWHARRSNRHGRGLSGQGADNRGTLRLRESRGQRLPRPGKDLARFGCGSARNRLGGDRRCPVGCSSGWRVRLTIGG